MWHALIEISGREVDIEYRHAQLADPVLTCNVGQEHGRRPLPASGSQPVMESSVPTEPDREDGSRLTFDCRQLFASRLQLLSVAQYTALSHHLQCRQHHDYCLYPSDGSRACR